MPFQFTTQQAEDLIEIIDDAFVQFNSNGAQEGIFIHLDSAIAEE